MKRILLEQKNKIAKQELTEERCENRTSVSDYISELRLLKDIPFQYLIAEENLLPPESIRFFYIDENWLNALTDGAMSVGRTARADAMIDGAFFEDTVVMATNGLFRPRFRRMHKNHRRFREARNVTSEARTGFILRSALVGKWKGLEVSGRGEGRELNILRMESLSSEILLCIFDGELEEFIISEPKTGLRFGAPDSSGCINLRDVKDTEDFGKMLKGVKLDLNEFTNSSGRIEAAKVAEEMCKKTGGVITSCEYAFELIAVAKQAEFKRGGD